MREIRLQGCWPQTIKNDWLGQWLSVHVRVDWPELQLTDEQILANGLARAEGKQEPYPDNSIFRVLIPRY